MNAEEQKAKAAPVGERQAFEAWFNREVWKDGCYGNPDILMRQLWPCWQARASLSPTPDLIAEAEALWAENERLQSACDHNKTCAQVANELSDRLGAELEAARGLPRRLVSTPPTAKPRLSSKGLN